MKFKLTLLLALLLTGTLPAAEPTDAQLLERGRTVAQNAFKELSSQLLLAMAKGGPTNAIEFCSVKALPLTQKVATAEGVNIRRVSHKPRNPANAATKEESALLEAFTKSIAAKSSPVPVIRRDSNGKAIFYAPITLNNPLCLNCHGDPAKDINKDALKVIKQRYPKDQATGFALNELRGMWRIEFQSAATP